MSPAALWASQLHAETEPPAVGRPPDFSGAVGSYEIIAEASPTEVFVEDPILLTVRITGSAPNRDYLPRRLKLTQLAQGVDKDFYVEDLPEKDGQPAKNTWEFFYRLRPKREDVTGVPRLRFVFYDPESKRFQPRLTPKAIALTVKPRPPVQPPQIEKRPAHPEPFYEIITGEAVLARPAHPLWRAAGLFLLLLTPPAACAIWYGVWRRLYPDAVDQLRQRRGLAARIALKKLEDKSSDGERVVTILTGYLRQRFELSTVEPTPTEAAEQLRAAGLSADVSKRVADVLRACDAARFAPSLAKDSESLTADANQVILAMEAELCAVQHA